MSTWNQVIGSDDMAIGQAAWLAYLAEAINQRSLVSNQINSIFGYSFGAYRTTDVNGNFIWQFPTGVGMADHSLWAGLQSNLSQLMQSSQWVNPSSKINGTNDNFNYYQPQDYFNACGIPSGVYPWFRRTRPREVLLTSQPTATDATDFIVRTILSMSQVGGTATVTTDGGTVYTAGDTVVISYASPYDYNGTQTVLTGGTGTFTFSVSGTATDFTGGYDTEGNILASGMIAWVSGDILNYNNPSIILGTLGSFLTTPTVAPTCYANSEGGTLPADTYRVAYTYYNGIGETCISPYTTVTITDNTAVATITFDGFVSDGDTITIDGFTFTFAVGGGTGAQTGSGSTVELTEPTGSVDVTFVQNSPSDVCTNFLGQLSNSAYTTSFTATAGGSGADSIQLTQATAGSSGNQNIVTRCTGIYSDGFWGGTSNEGSINVSMPDLPTGAKLAMVYLAEENDFSMTFPALSFNDSTDTQDSMGTIVTLTRLSNGDAAKTPPNKNYTQWYPATSTAVPDLLDSWGSAPNTVASPLDYCTAGDYLGSYMITHMRTILNMMQLWGKFGTPTNAELVNRLYGENPNTGGSPITDSTLAGLEATLSGGFPHSAYANTFAGIMAIKRLGYVASGPTYFGAINNAYCNFNYTNTQNYGLSRTVSWYVLCVAGLGTGGTTTETWDTQGLSFLVQNQIVLFLADAAQTTDLVTTSTTFNSAAEPPDWGSVPPTGTTDSFGWVLSKKGVLFDYSGAGGFSELASSA